jgi:hypothetical protein
VFNILTTKETYSLRGGECSVKHTNTLEISDSFVLIFTRTINFGLHSADTKSITFSTVEEIVVFVQIVISLTLYGQEPQILLSRVLCPLVRGN